MKDFIKVVEVQGREVDKYLEDGWELIETTKEAYGDGEYYLKYHLGLPARIVMIKLKKIIEAYEENGFKEQLFEKVAVNNGEDYSVYTDAFNMGYVSKDATIDFMESYERDVHDKKVSYFKKGDKEADIHF